MNPIWKMLLGVTWVIVLVVTLWIGFLSTKGYIERNAQWEAEWKKAKGVNEELAKALEAFEKERKAVDVVLSAWKNQNDENQKEIADARKRIRILEESNEHLRDVLCTVVPPELWGEIFPSSNFGKGDGVQGGGASCPAPAVPRPARTREKDSGRSSRVYPVPAGD